jgi:hypothetical protein
VRSFLRRLGFAAAIGAAGGVLSCLSCLIAYLTGSVAAGGFTGIILGTGLVIKALLVGGERGGLEGDGVFLGLMAAIAASAAGFMWSLPLMEVRRLAFSEQREVSIAELASHPGVARFQLRDGRVEAQAVHKHYHLHPGNEVSSSYDHAVVPVLPTGWRPGEPVRVWAVCHHFANGYPEKDACLEAWREPTGGAVVIEPELEPCFQPAVPAAYVPPDGYLVFVHWVKSPEAYLEARWDEVLGFLRGTAIFWCALAVLWLVGTSALRNKRA